MSTTAKAMPSRHRGRARQPAAVTPIRPIRNDADYDRVVAELDRLVLRNDLDRDEQDHFDVLTVLIEHYDEAHYPREPDTRTVLERLKSLMASSETTPAKLGDVMGSRPAASMVLAGDRELSKAHIRRLAAYFRISPAYFF